jgi:DNA-binding transcriptional ArsR family regulator
MVNPVVNPVIDRVLQALADPSRRQIVERLMSSPESVTELARPLAMSLPAVMRHLSVLENSGLVSSRKVGRVRTCSIEPQAFRQLESWVVDLRAAWDDRLDALGDYLDGAPHTAPKSKGPTP